MSLFAMSLFSARIASPFVRVKTDTFFKRLVEFQTFVLGSARPGKRNFWGIHSLASGSISLWRPQSRHHPATDHLAEPVHRVLVKREPYRRLRQLLAIAQEDAALPEQPDRGNRDRALVGIGQKTAHQISGKSEKRCGLLGHEVAEYRCRLHGFPIENAHVAAVLVAPQQRLQLTANELR